MCGIPKDACTDAGTWHLRCTSLFSCSCSHTYTCTYGLVTTRTCIHAARHHVPIQPCCSFSHAHTLMHNYLFTCVIASPHSVRADWSQAHPMLTHKATGRNRYPQSHSDIPTHAPVRADRHHTSTNAHMHKHDTCPQWLCTHAQTLPYRAYNTCLAHIHTHAAAHALVHARSYRRAAGEPTHSLTQACSHSLTFHRDLSNGFYDSQTGHGHTRVVG